MARGGALQRYLTHNDVKDLLRPVMKQPMLNWKDSLKVRFNALRHRKDQEGGGDSVKKHSSEE